MYIHVHIIILLITTVKLIVCCVIKYFLQPAALCTLLKLYSDIDFRCIQLAVLFRLWAKVKL